MDSGEDYTDFKRRMTRLPNPLLDSPTGEESANHHSDDDEWGILLNDFLLQHGFEPRKRSTMRRFVQQHDIEDEGKSTNQLDESDEEFAPPSSFNYVGDCNWGQKKPRNEYLAAVESERLSSSIFSPVAFKDFQESLYGLSLNSNDVRGIQKLTESNHVGQMMKSGPYKGLDRNMSAIEVSTLVFEQVGAYEKLRSRGQLQEGVPIMEAELERRGFPEAVKATVSNDWGRLLNSEKQYQEMVQESSSKYRRSDLTTANSLRLYTSFFSPDQVMASPELSILLGDTPPVGDREANSAPNLRQDGLKFVRRAAEMGIPIISHAELANARDRPLFELDHREVPAGFEKINEDMFSRKDNKFMVFNGPGVHSWGHDNNPITPTAGIEKILEGTLT